MIQSRTKYLRQQIRADTIKTQWFWKSGFHMLQCCRTVSGKETRKCRVLIRSGDCTRVVGGISAFVKGLSQVGVSQEGGSPVISRFLRDESMSLTLFKYVVAAVVQSCRVTSDTCFQVSKQLLTFTSLSSRLQFRE